MSLSMDQVQSVAKLARLKLTNEEEKTFATQLSSVLDYINQLGELNTDNVEPTSHALKKGNVFREDVAWKPFAEDAWRKNAPSQDHDHLRVPRVIED